MKTIESMLDNALSRAADLQDVLVKANESATAVESIAMSDLIARTHKLAKAIGLLLFSVSADAKEHPESAKKSTRDTIDEIRAARDAAKQARENLRSGYDPASSGARNDPIDSAINKG